jgi:L-rhamnose mutarotase
MHFSVLVVGENFEDQLEPFCELECTMDQQQIMDDPRSEFTSEYTTEELEKDFLDVKNEHPEYYYETLEEFAEDYHGISKLEGEEIWGRYTNPRSQWDWYSVGGRYTGKFKIKENPKYPDDIVIGSPGLMTKPPENGNVDSIRLCDIDFDGMKKDSIKKHENFWDEFQKEIASGNNTAYYLYDVDPNDTKETYVEKHSRFSIFAYIKDGEWFEKGWDSSNDEKNSDWKDEVNNLIKSLPEDALLTIVDCHV